MKVGDKVKAYQPKTKNLTHNKKYEIFWILDNTVSIRNDNGKIKQYSKKNFK